MKAMQEELAEVAGRGLGWLGRQLGPDGSYRETLPCLAAYYKAPYLWAAAGRPREFARVTRHVENQFHGPEGFHSAVDPQAPVYNQHFFNYMMGWVARGALVGGNLGLAGRAYAYLRQPAGRGLMATCGEGPRVVTGVQDIGTASNAGVSFLYGGDRASAEQCARFVWSTFENQDRKGRLYVRADAEGEVLRDFPDQDAAVSVIDFDKPDQMYWYLGIAMAFFGKMFEVLDEPAYLEKAAVAFECFDRCRPRVAEDDLTVGKVGYGTAVLHRLTGKQAYLSVCRECMDNLRRTQQPEGYWLYERRGDIRQLARSTLLDFAAELTIWCLEVTKELAAAGNA